MLKRKEDVLYLKLGGFKVWVFWYIYYICMFREVYLLYVMWFCYVIVINLMEIIYFGIVVFDEYLLFVYLFFMYV